MINKRFIIGDEFELDLNYFENMMKNVFAGLLAEAKKKFTGSEYIDRTPFMILSNYDNLFPMEQEVWKSRILLEHVQNVPWLKQEVSGKIHPYAWKMLFQKYGVVSQAF